MKTDPITFIQTMKAITGSVQAFTLSFAPEQFQFISVTAKVEVDMHNDAVCVSFHGHDRVSPTLVLNNIERKSDGTYATIAGKRQLIRIALTEVLLTTEWVTWAVHLVGHVIIKTLTDDSTPSVKPPTPPSSDVILSN